MQDSERAEILSRALDTHESVPEDIEDQELVALVKLGADLERQGANLASIQSADVEFRPAFAHSLRESLLAQHPGALRNEGPATAPRAANPRSRKPLTRTARTRAYRAILLPFLAVALIVTTLNAIMHPASTPRLAGGPVVTATHAGEARATSARATAKVEFNTFASEATTATGSTPKAAPGAYAPKVGQTPHGTARAVAGGVAPVPVVRMVPRTAATPTPVKSASANGSNAGHSAGTPQAQRSAILAGVEPTPSTFESLAMLLPAALPKFPARADVFPLVFVRFSTTDQARIAGTFAGMLATGDGSYQDADGRQRLTFDTDASRGVTYRLQLPSKPVAQRGSLDAERSAVTWLREHDLIPTGAKLGQAHTVRSNGTSEISFSPPQITGLPKSAAPVGIVVKVDGSGVVTSAQVHWPVLGHGRPESVQDLRQTLAANVAATDSVRVQTTAGANKRNTETVQIDAVEIVYGTAGTGPALTWQPYYRLTGHVTAGSDAGKRIVKLVPAVAAVQTVGNRPAR